MINFFVIKGGFESMTYTFVSYSNFIEYMPCILDLDGLYKNQPVISLTSQPLKQVLNLKKHIF